MKLSDKDVQKAQEHCQKWAGECKICGHKSWTLVDTLHMMPEYGDLLYNARVAAYLVLACEQCYNTLFFNAKLMGLDTSRP